MKWRANFFDKNGEETRSLVVETPGEDDETLAGELACDEADRRKWPESFEFSDVECLNE